MTETTKPVFLSIVTTLYGSEATIMRFLKEAAEIAAQFGPSHEIIVVNDGSPDRSRAIVLEQMRQQDHIVLIDLSRNFGHHQAFMVGLDAAQGEYVFAIDCDLEEDLNWLPTFRAKMDEEDADMVSGVQAVRKGRAWERMSGALFYSLFDRLSAVQTPRNPTTARLMTRRFVEAVLQFKDKRIFMLGIFAYVGFHQVTVPVIKTSQSQSTYRLRDRLSLALTAFTSFSTVPLRFGFYAGIGVCGLSGLGIIGTLIVWVVSGQAPGWPLLGLLILSLLAGLILLVLGIQGLYLARLMDMQQRRPQAIIATVQKSGSSQI